ANRRSPRHRGKRQRYGGLKGVLTSLCAVPLGSFAAILATAGTYATWNDASAIVGTTITSGRREHTVTGDISSTHWSKLLPGEHHVQFISIENTGNIPLQLSVLSAQSGGDAGSFELRLELVGQSQSCGSSVLGANALGNMVVLGE